MNDQVELAKYMRTLGKRGGQARSPEKTKAVRKNLAKARAALQTQRLGLPINGSHVNGGGK